MAVRERHSLARRPQHRRSMSVTRWNPHPPPPLTAAGHSHSRACIRVARHTAYFLAIAPPAALHTTICQRFRPSRLPHGVAVYSRHTTSQSGSLPERGAQHSVQYLIPLLQRLSLTVLQSIVLGSIPSHVRALSTAIPMVTPRNFLPRTSSGRSFTLTEHGLPWKHTWICERTIQAKRHTIAVIPFGQLHNCAASTGIHSRGLPSQDHKHRGTSHA